MIDDDKRRETARRLRAAAEQADPAVGVSETEIFCILDVDLGGERGFADRQDVLRLADLIDRRAIICLLEEENELEPKDGQC